MNIQERYESAKEIYAGLGVDVDAAVERLKNIPVSMHCWQGDDVMGFEGADSLSGGIQATGNYPGKARNPQELMADIDKALSLIPGKHRNQSSCQLRHFHGWGKSGPRRTGAKAFCKVGGVCQEERTGTGF